MKPSHLQTPRSLSEGSFTTGYTTGPAYRSGFDPADRIVLWGCAVAFVAFLVLVVL